MFVFLFILTVFGFSEEAPSVKIRDLSSQNLLIENLKKSLSIQEGSYSADSDENENCPDGELSFHAIDDSVVLRLDDKVLISDIKGEKNVLSFKESGCQHDITVLVEKNLITRTKIQTCKKDSYSFFNQVRFEGDKITQVAESKKNNAVTLKINCILQKQK